MTRQIEPTPVLEGEVARKFIEYINRPPTEEEIEFERSVDEIFKKINFNFEELFK